MPSPAKRSTVPSNSHDERAHRAVILAQHRFHFLGLRGVGERGEAAQVDEHVADLAPMRRKDRFLADREDRVRDCGREEALQLAHALDLGHLLRDALLELRVPFLQSVGLAPHLVLQRLDAQQRAHAREQLGLVDGLRQEIVGAGLDALDPLLLRVERRDEHDRQERGGGVGAQPTTHVVARQARHHDVEQHEIGRVGRDLGERFFAVHGRRDRVALDREQVGQQLDVVRRVVDHQHLGRIAHFATSLRRLRLGADSLSVAAIARRRDVPSLASPVSLMRASPPWCGRCPGIPSG